MMIVGSSCRFFLMSVATNCCNITVDFACRNGKMSITLSGIFIGHVI